LILGSQGPASSGTDLAFHAFVHIVDYGANRTVRKCTVEPEHESLPVEARIQAAGIGPVWIDRACVADQEGAWRTLEAALFAVTIFDSVFRHEILFRHLQAVSKAINIPSLQRGAEDLTAIPAFSTFNLFGYCLQVPVNYGVYFFDCQIAPAEQALKTSVVTLTLSCPFFDLADVGFELHVRIPSA
jgi:hypothetical protein